MKEFLDSTYGRTLIIAFIAAGTAVFASDWSNGFADVARPAGGAFFGALASLVAYLKVNSSRNKEQPENDVQAPPILVARETPEYPLRYPQAFNEPPRQENIVRRNVPRPPPVPPVDFDQPYHRSLAGIAHPGSSTSDGCGWCATEAKV